MKQPVSDINNSCNRKDLKIIIEKMPDFHDEEVFISDFINWQPLCDLYIMNDEVVVTIEIAGVGTKDFSVYINKDSIIIDGTRRSPDVFTDECCTFHTIEIPYGRFIRKIDFPVPVEPKQYKAGIDKGILRIKIPVLKERIIPIEDG